jgi:RNA polymerase sigma-70 factor (ECF subfamily)
MWFPLWTAITSSSRPERAASASLPSEAGGDDARLVERCHQGDYAAFDEIVARHQNRIFNLCYWMLSDRDEAADAAQDAFVRAYRSMANFRAESTLGTWLHRIAVNVCLDAKAKRTRTPVPYSTLEKPDAEGDTQNFDPADQSDTPDESLARRERRQAVLQALARVSEEHRAVLVLFDIQGHSYEDAARALDLPMGTVKSRLNRARAALRRELESCRELFED